MFAAMLHHEQETDTSSLQLCVSGGAAIPRRGCCSASRRRFRCTVLEGLRAVGRPRPLASFKTGRDREAQAGLDRPPDPAASR